MSPISIPGLTAIFLLQWACLTTGMMMDEDDICSVASFNSYECFCTHSSADCTFNSDLPEDWKLFVSESVIKSLTLDFGDNVDEDHDSFPIGILKNFPYLEELKIVDGNMPSLKSKALHGSAVIKEIFIQNNRMKELKPKSVSDLANLFKLTLRNEEILNIGPNVFTNLPKIEELELDYNEIENIADRAFDGLSSLQSLHLNDNRLKSIKKGMFKGLADLKKLHLQKNKISKLEFGCFSGMKMLVYLDLSHNEIQSIPGNFFTGLSGLRVLMLFNNKLSKFNDESFNGLEKMDSIDLTHNQMKTIRKSWFKYLNLNTSDVDLKIKSNPFVCECELHWLFSVTENYLFETEIRDLTCKVPRRFPSKGLKVGSNHKLEDIKDKLGPCSGKTSTKESTTTTTIKPTEPNIPVEKNESEINGQRKSDKHYVESKEAKGNGRKLMALNSFFIIFISLIIL